MRIPILGIMVDERFLAHRQRSTSLAGFPGALVAIGWFWYRLVFTGVWRWDLLSVAIAMVVVKWALMMMGMAFMVLGQLWRFVPVTGGLSEDAVDAIRGVFLGLSIGLLLWSVWLNGRIRRGKKN